MIDEDDVDEDEENRLEQWFDKVEDEYGEFENIPEADRRHPRPDICALIYLHEKLGGKGDAISAAEHDEIYLDWEKSRLEFMTEEDVLYVTRCGVRYDPDTDCLAMFV